MKKTTGNAPVSRSEDFRNNMGDMASLTWRKPEVSRGWTTVHIEQPARKRNPGGPVSGN